MSEPRIVNIMEFLDRSSRVINLKIRLRMTALQFGILHSTNKPVLVVRGVTGVPSCLPSVTQLVEVLGLEASSAL